ncbi:hypothetical protein [Paraburkholderia sp. GAS348]|uniref:hypothetical protein n=1 Tax=Paraburkholderia sp. GAS348 TaxID=3035132 RepID=UPI003D1F3956
MANTISNVFFFCATPLLTVLGDEDTDAEVESSAPQPLNANVASATKTALARRVSVRMAASQFVTADAVSIPFEKYL